MFVGGVAAALLLGTLVPPRLYPRDLMADYLPALAVRSGHDPFANIDDLAGELLGLSLFMFPHPNPHPPALVVAFVPLTFLPYEAVFVLWTLGGLGLLALIGRWLGLSPLATLALVAWPPLWVELYIGNWQIVLLALCLAGWRAAERRRDGRAGVWLGLAASIKLFPVLLLLPFFARRRWRLVAVAAAVLFGTQVVGLLAFGPEGFRRYWLEVLPAVNAHYRALGYNSTPYGALLRIFGGASDVPPLIEAPGLALPLAAAIALVGLVALLRLPPERGGPALLVALPSASLGYALLALPAIVGLLREPGRRWQVLVASAAASVVLPLVNFCLQAAPWLGAAGAVLLASLQPLGYLLLLALALRTGAPALPGSGQPVGARAAGSPL